MSKAHRATVQKQFTNTVEAFSKCFVRDTPEVLAETVEFLRPQPTDLTLDVACGPGPLVLALARRVRFARGIDLTEAMLRQAREFQKQRGVPNAAFEQGEAEHLPYADATFDLVTCQCSIHHMTKPERSFEEMVRVTKPEGRLAVIDSLAPESDSKFELHNRIENVRDPSHTASLRLTTLLRMFEDLGLVLTRQSVRRRRRPFDEWMLRAGLKGGDKRYEETRRLLEASIPGDTAGLGTELRGRDLSIVHHVGLFLLERGPAGS